MKISTFLYGVIFFSLVVTSLGAVWSDFAGYYGLSVSSDYAAPYDYINNTQQFSASAYDNAWNGTIDTAAQDIAVYKDVITVAKNTKDSVSWIKNMGTSLTLKLHLPPVFYVSFITLVILGLVYGLLRLIFKLDV